ncbi:MAG: paraquat-inducible protein A, partial [Terriglobales bacterium]
MDDCNSALGGYRPSRMLQHSQAVLIGCTDCGLVQRLPPLSAGSMAECVRCGHGLVRSGGGGADISLAFTMAALLLLLPAVLSPLMSLICFGVRRQNLLPTGVEALWGHGFDSLAVVIFMFSIAIPLAYLGLMGWVLGALRFRAPPAVGRLFRWAGELRPWAMLEVYLVGCCVAYTRLQDIGTVRVNVGGWCLIGATLSALL